MKFSGGVAVRRGATDTMRCQWRPPTRKMGDEDAEFWARRRFILAGASLSFLPRVLRNDLRGESACGN